MKKITIFILSLILCYSLSLSSFAATSVSYNGITWNFDGDYTVGQFVTGDYWVVGPVTITSTTPAWDGTKNGSMLDPLPLSYQGYDTRLDYGYNNSNRVSFPTTISGIKSLVTAKCLPTLSSGGAKEGLDKASVLTIVNSPPASNTFRPAYAYGAKTFYTTTEVNYDLVPLLPTPSGISLPNYANFLKYVWLDHGPAVTGSTIHPQNNMPPYPRDSAFQVSQLSLVMMLDVEDRTEIINRMIQLGIDLYSISLNNGEAFSRNGGFGYGRKWPILFAGILLDITEMKNPPTIVSVSLPVRKFQEDGYTYLGESTETYPDGKPLWGYQCQYGYSPPYWVNHDCRDLNGLLDPEQMTNGGYYRDMSYCCVGFSLAAKLMGSEDVWAWNPFFAYMDRWMLEESDGGSTFVNSMWNTYENFANGILSSPDWTSIHGDTDQIDLAWSHSIPSYIDHYTIYRSTSSLGPYSLLSDNIVSTTYTDSTVSTDGTVYYYKVQAHSPSLSSTSNTEISGYTTLLWGQDDFEYSNWSGLNPNIFNDISWTFPSGSASTFTTSNLAPGMNTKWIRPGRYNSTPTYMLSEFPIDINFIISFDNFQEYANTDKGIVLLYVDSNNYYRIRITRYNFIIQRMLGGSLSAIGTSSTLAMQHDASSANYEITVENTGTSIQFTCEKSNWYKVYPQTTDNTVYSSIYQDTNSTALTTFTSGKIGFYQLTTDDWNVPSYDNVIITQLSNEATPAPTSTLTPTPSDTPIPTSTFTPTNTPTPTNTQEPAPTKRPRKRFLNGGFNN